MPKIALNWQNILEIDVTPTGPMRTFARLCEGLSNLSESLNEKLFQAAFLCSQGWGSTEVTGGQYIATVTGVRYFGDPAQDWIFSDDVQLKFGDARKTTLRITRGNEAILEWDVTLAHIAQTGGDSADVTAISFEIHGNGQPRLLTNNYLELLTIVSVAGTLAGDTNIYVNPIIASGHSYKYRVGTNAELPLYDAVLSTGWDAWDGTAPIKAEAGLILVLVEVETSSSKAKKGGRVIVQAN